MSGRSTSILATILFIIYSQNVYSVEFNLDVVDSKSKDNINFARFSEAGYILPGKYQLNLVLNGQGIGSSTYTVNVLERENKSQDENKKLLSQACLTGDIISSLGLKEKIENNLPTWNDGKCIDLLSLDGVEVTTKLNEGILSIKIPQIWLEYTSATWLPPSRWDDGISGLILDYNINTNVNIPHEGSNTQSIYYNGTVGYNFGSWRIRSDYQGNYNRTSGDAENNKDLLNFTRVYGYRAIRSLKSNLTIGENFINSNIFNSWRYTGISLESDDRMLSPQLRGYAPQVTGIAETNARVVVKHQGRILYDSTVPAGPFAIQDLDSSVRGKLDVEIIEQNGKTNKFQIDTAYVPYLTRPGQVRYKVVAGRSRDKLHNTEGPIFGTTEAAFGLSNAWTMYGGTIFAGDYNSVALGVGRDMFAFGAVSADITQSYARLPDRGTMQGKSWRVSYSKRFDNLDADVTFAGYRFNERNYMTMQNYLDARYRDDFTGKEKELYTVTFNKGLSEYNTSIGVQYNHQTYWDQSNSDYYSINLNKYMDVFAVKNISLNLSASRSKYYGKDNDVFFARVSIPLENNRGFISYDGSKNSGNYTHNIGYFNTSEDNLANYNLNVSTTYGDDMNSSSSFSGYYGRYTSIANINANATISDNNTSSFGFSANGGLTITAKGAALHPGGFNGGTRLLVDTEGVAGVPVDGGRVTTNNWGYGVVTDINSYYRNETSIDLTKLPNNIEATQAIVESSLTEGAIGYRKFEVLKGEKAFAIIRLADNSYPPFGSIISNAKGRELGIISDDGFAWLTGINPNEEINVSWGAEQRCVAKLPNKIEPSNKILLLCEK
ncbi:TPA: fimbria/pilus outer membrane usher protein [Proteus mirabilis]|nr:fimbria/pilus outer membrane usher protein [Proteus mirabilis]